ncbi:hypothetical protein B9J90_01275 [Vibrio sp. V09_P4A23P171]|uniref:COG3650 family protein n=1 Tax=Vibrio sp. V09_P4A23P171 TaxID=1938664 RepID=UPI000B8E6428|nr:hypothetical protein [Vibrio sp. V09_P4A23P171]OXX39305.1 hypothetical protein B9J90_01275 [Vibrio sp. V09_P4A23P171]
MKVLHCSALLLTTLMLQACATKNASLPPAVPMASLDKPSSIKAQPFIMRGEVVVGHEAQTFTPCGSNQQYWLALTPQQTQQALSLARSPYQPLYGELIGTLSAPSRTGFDADSSARFNVTSINMLSAENPKRCNQPLKPTRAFGNEPSWSIHFEGKNLNFQTISGETQTFAITKSQLSETKREYQMNQGSLLLTQKMCSDGMSDSLYGWSSTLKVGEKSYQGCATLGNSDATLPWVGAYHATSTQNRDFTIRLQLNADHTASTHYDYNDGQPSTVEKGFWQPLNLNQIQVVMTRHQQQYLLSERLFTRTGYQLKAEKEKVGDVLYPIANGGLTLFSENIETP